MAVSATTLGKSPDPDAQEVSGTAPKRPGTPSVADTVDRRARVVDQLFERYRVRLLSFVAGLMSSVPDAEDVVQETYRRLLEVPSLDTTEARVRGLIFRIATNLAYDRFRARGVRGRRVEFDDCDLADDELDPGRLVDIEQCAEVIRQTLLDIKPRSRQVFLLRASEHLSYDEIAVRLGVSKRTVEREIRHVIGVCQQNLRGK